MTLISTLKAVRLFKEKGVKFVRKTDVMRLFGFKTSNTAYKFLQRQEKKGVIKRIVAGKYLVEGSPVNDFLLANIAVSPSYISLETALNFYGILPQFPYAFTSITPGRNTNFELNGKSFEYFHLSGDLFRGYIKNKDFLIATPEKAILDTLYFCFKGLRRTYVDEWDFSSVNKSTLKKYLMLFSLKKGFRNYVLGLKIL